MTTLNNVIKNHISNYESFEEFEEQRNIDREEFEELLDENWIVDITLSTYNGATRETWYHELNEETIYMALKQELYVGNWYETIDEWLDDDEEFYTDNQYILEMLESNDFFTLEGHLYYYVN